MLRWSCSTFVHEHEHEHVHEYEDVHEYEYKYEARRETGTQQAGCPPSDHSTSDVEHGDDVDVRAFLPADERPAESVHPAELHAYRDRF
jgi:hypothetical protein